jgi:hypothetical protein
MVFIRRQEDQTDPMAVERTEDRLEEKILAFRKRRRRARGETGKRTETLLTSSDVQEFPPVLLKRQTNY